MKQLDVLLIHPSTTVNEKKANQTIMSNTLIGYGLLSIGTFLKKNGYEVEIWNTSALYYDGLTKENVISILKKYDPLVIGIELNWLHFSKGAFEWAEILKNVLPNSKIVMGGVHQNIILKMLNYSGNQLKKLFNYIDVFFIGEAEKSFLSYVEAVKNNKNTQDINGTITFKNDVIIDNGPPKIFNNIDEIPPYDLNIVRPKLKGATSFILINTCRGPCKHECIYCIGSNKTYGSTRLSPRKQLAFHSPKWVIAQIQYALQAVKSVNLSIQDYIYCNPKKINEIALEIQKHPEFQEKIRSFNLAVLPGSIDFEIYRNLSRAGIDNIDFGVESGSNKVLRILKRPYNTKNVKDSIKSCVKNGIIAKTYWMVGLPGEEREKLNLTKKFIQETINLGGIPRWITPVCIFPSLEIYENAKEYGIIPRFTSFRDYFVFSEAQRNKNYSYPEVITHQTIHMNHNEIVKAANEIKQYIIENRERILKIQRNYLDIYANVHTEYAFNSLEVKINTALERIEECFF